MPPRYAYWTIIVDNQPTAFRSGSQEELMPTFKRLKAKNDTAVMMWFQIGKLWPSRIDAQEFMRARGEMGRKSDERQGGFRDRERRPALSERREWRGRATSERRESKGEPSTPAPARNADDKLDWKPKGEFVPAPKRAERPEWKPKTSRPQDLKTSAKPEWKPKGSFTPAPRRDDGGWFAKPDWKSKSSRPQGPRTSRPEGSERPEWRPKSQAPGPKPYRRPDFKSSGDQTRAARPEWKPKGSFKPQAPSPRTSDSQRPEWKPKGSFKPQAPSPKPPDGEKRKWVPKEEYKKSMGIEARRDSKWRPGGEHKDPKQKFKDAKKAKWTKFKQNIRARSGGKGKKQS